MVCVMDGRAGWPMISSCKIYRMPVARRYGRLRAHLRAIGQPIGPNDLWIAAHALARDVPLITHNLSEFRRVPGLAVETWMTA